MLWSIWRDWTFLICFATLCILSIASGILMSLFVVGVEIMAWQYWLQSAALGFSSVIVSLLARVVHRILKAKCSKFMEH